MTKEEKEAQESRMLQLITSSLESGKSHREYCKLKGISEARYYYWLKRYHQKKDPVQGVTFLPLSIKSTEPFHQEIEISYPNGVRVKISHGWDKHLLQSLIGLGTCSV